MGWTFMHRPRGISDRAWFEREGCFTWSHDTRNRRVVDTATVNRTVFHAVLEMDAEADGTMIPDANGRVRIAFVFLLKWVPSDHHNFGYKDLDEFMGPCEAVCPERLLDQLTPFKPEAIAAAEAAYAAELAAVEAGTLPYASRSTLLHAHDWRQRCRRLIEVRKATRQPGTKLKLINPLRFSDGVTATELTVGELDRNQPTFRRQDGIRVRISRSEYGLFTLA